MRQKFQLLPTYQRGGGSLSSPEVHPRRFFSVKLAKAQSARPRTRTWWSDSIIIKIGFHATKRANEPTEDSYLRARVRPTRLCAGILHNPLLERCVDPRIYVHTRIPPLAQYRVKNNAMGESSQSRYSCHRVLRSSRSLGGKMPLPKYRLRY